MKESTTYQATLVEGGVLEARRFLLRLGTKKLGSPSASVVNQVEAINDAEQLEKLGEEIHRVSNWDELLASSGPTPRRTRRKNT